MTLTYSRKQTARLRPSVRRLAQLSALPLAIGVLASCSSDEPASMPDLGGMRLDVAMSDLDAAGVGEGDVEVLGGGTFGVIDESNWEVCDQEPAAGSSVDGSVRVTVDRTCEAEDDIEGEPSADTSPEPEEPSSAQPTEAAGDKRRDRQRRGGVADTFVMPNLVGAGLQDAQDLLQSLGSFLLSQDDATGQDRFQVFDSDWKVCSQRPAAGTPTDLLTMVDLDVVKLAESCP